MKKGDWSQPGAESLSKFLLASFEYCTIVFRVRLWCVIGFNLFSDTFRIYNFNTETALSGLSDELPCQSEAESTCSRWIPNNSKQSFIQSAFFNLWNKCAHSQWLSICLLFLLLSQVTARVSLETFTEARQENRALSKPRPGSCPSPLWSDTLW